MSVSARRAAKETGNKIGCRFCNWKTLRWRTLKTGQVSGPDAAMARLRSHIADVHPAEFDKIYGEP